MDIDYETLSSSSGSQDGDEVYDVEAIRNWRYNRATKSREFLIKWYNYAEEENTWEPEGNLDCREKMEQFIAGLNRRQRRRFNKTNLENLNGLERNAEIVSIEADRIFPKISLHIKGGISSTEQNSEDDPHQFYLMIAFADNEQDAEVFSLDQLYQHHPAKAFEWVEQRLITKEALIDCEEMNGSSVL